MAIFSVIDTGATGDTPYEGFVKSAANWAILETELTNARGGESSLDDRLDALDTLVASKAGSDHTHGAGGTVISIVADAAALWTGATDGEMKLCADNGNRYTWESTGTKWRVMDGNKYTTAALPTTAYNIATGTLVYDTTTNYWKRWNGSAFVNAFLTWDGGSTDVVAATARASIVFTDGLKEKFLL